MKSIASFEHTHPVTFILSHDACNLTRREVTQNKTMTSYRTGHAVFHSIIDYIGPSYTTIVPTPLKLRVKIIIKSNLCYSYNTGTRDVWNILH